MKNRLRKLAIIVLIVIFLCAICLVIRHMLDYRHAEQSNSKAQNIVGATFSTIVAPSDNPASSPADPTDGVQTSDECTPYLQQLDIRALQKVNPDVIGWIYIPNTNINYPLLHAEDNNTYLHTTWDGNDNTAGSIFLETCCSPDLQDFNTIIYGHNMRNGSMFAALKHYRDYDYYKAHPYVYIVTADAVYRYEVFSSYEAGVTTDTYRLRFTKDEKEQSLHYYINSSVWEAALTPSTDDFILTLSTCTGNGKYETRWVVQAALNSKWDR